MPIWVYSQQQTRHKSSEAATIILHLLLRKENKIHESSTSGALAEPAMLPLCRDLARRSVTRLRIRSIQVIAPVATGFVLTTAFLAPGTTKLVIPKCPAVAEMTILTGDRHQNQVGSSQCCQPSSRTDLFNLLAVPMQNENFLSLSYLQPLRRKGLEKTTAVFYKLFTTI